MFNLCLVVVDSNILYRRLPARIAHLHSGPLKYYQTSAKALVQFWLNWNNHLLDDASCQNCISTIVRLGNSDFDRDYNVYQHQRCIKAHMALTHGCRLVLRNCIWQDCSYAFLTAIYIVFYFMSFSVSVSVNLCKNKFQFYFSFSFTFLGFFFDKKENHFNIK